jgi:hypothetical protein
MEEQCITEALKHICDCNVRVGDTEYMQLARKCDSGWALGSALCRYYVGTSMPY